MYRNTRIRSHLLLKTVKILLTKQQWFTSQNSDDSLQDKATAKQKVYHSCCVKDVAAMMQHKNINNEVIS